VVQSRRLRVFVTKVGARVLLSQFGQVQVTAGKLKVDCPVATIRIALGMFQVLFGTSGVSVSGAKHD
jgi:hypothetical protein